NKLEEYKNAILTEEVYDLAHELLDERSHYEHNLAQSEELSKEIEQSNADINMTLNDLAIPLNKEALKDVNLPYYLTKTWKTLETNINQLKQILLPISELDKLKEQLLNYSHTSKQVNDLQEQSTDQNLKKKIGLGGIALVVTLLIITIITTNTFFIISTIITSIVLVGLYYVVNFFEQKNQALIDSLVNNQGDQLTKDEYLKIKNQVDKQDDYLIQLKY